MLLRRRSRFSLDAWRLRLIRETETALLHGLLHPKSVPRIPTVEVGKGSFESVLAEQWWTGVLDIDGEAHHK